VALQHTVPVSAARIVGPGEDVLARWRDRFQRLHLDLGCGDARFALQAARGTPDLGVVGIDTCLDNVRVPRRYVPANLRLIQADGRDIAGLPGLQGADRITINFPYGSLLRWIVDGGTGFIDRLATVAASGAMLEIRINASALREIGSAPAEFEPGLVDAFARRREWKTAFQTMGQSDLRRFPSTWARRIGYGRETTALLVVARRVG